LAREGKKNGYLFSAIQYLGAASNIHPEFIDPYLHIASCYEELGETEKACTAFKQALSIYAGDETAQNGIKRCCDGISTDDDTSKQTDENIIIIDEEGNDYSEEIEVVEISTNDDEGVQEEIFETLDEKKEKPLVSSFSQENDPISSILNQFKDEEETNKNVPPQPVSAPAQPEDDPIASILAQFKDDVEPAIGANMPAPATSDSAKVSGKHAILDILDQYKDDIADGTNEAANNIESPRVIKTVGSQEMIQDLFSQYSDDDPIADTATDIPHTGNAPEIGKSKEIQECDETVMHPVILTEEQKDAFQELGNIGASHAATTLSTMLQTTILMNVPEIRILSVDEIGDYIGNGDSTFAIFTMEGEIQQAGYVILQVMNESVIQISAIMLGMPSEPREMNEMDESAITEIGNIMVSAFLDGTAELLDIIMLPSPPRTVMGRASTVISDVAHSGDINCDNIVFFKTEMICNDYSLQCNILMMPSQSVLSDILEMLENLIKINKK
jgi:chemotaxis protein CheC